MCSDCRTGYVVTRIDHAAYHIDLGQYVLPCLVYVAHQKISMCCLLVKWFYCDPFFLAMYSTQCVNKILTYFKGV